MGFPSAPLRRKGSCERQSCQQATVSTCCSRPRTSWQHFSSTGATKRDLVPQQPREQCTVTVRRTGPGLGLTEAAPSQREIPLMKRSKQQLPSQMTQQGQHVVLVGKISMPQTPLALMGDGEGWFPGHPHTLEPAAVSGFHRIHWLGR